MPAPAMSSSCRVPTRAAGEATGLEWLLLRRAQAKVHIKDLTKHMDTTNLAVREARDLQEMVEWCGTRGGRQLGSMELEPRRSHRHSFSRHSGRGAGQYAYADTTHDMRVQLNATIVSGPFWLRKVAGRSWSDATDGGSN